MEAAEAAKVKVGKRVGVHLRAGDLEQGTVVALDEHGLALLTITSYLDETYGPIYFPWSNVSSVRWLGGDNE